MKVVLASNNLGKVREFEALLAPYSLDIVTQNTLGIEDAEETGLTFVENALIKARHATAKSGLPALADDSGLTVDALAGAPGIYSARYAGVKASAKDNIFKLLTELRDVPEKNRHASFYCVLVFMLHPLDPTPIICYGKWDGYILTEPQGTEGFGYDPIFYVPEERKSAAELSASIKNRISHRAIALNALTKKLPFEVSKL